MMRFIKGVLKAVRDVVVVSLGVIIGSLVTGFLMLMAYDDVMLYIFTQAMKG